MAEPCLQVIDPRNQLARRRRGLVAQHYPLVRGPACECHQCHPEVQLGAADVVLVASLPEAESGTEVLFQDCLCHDGRWGGAQDRDDHAADACQHDPRHRQLVAIVHMALVPQEHEGCHTKNQHAQRQPLQCGVPALKDNDTANRAHRQVHLAQHDDECGRHTCLVSQDSKVCAQDEEKRGDEKPAQATHREDLRQGPLPVQNHRACDGDAEGEHTRHKVDGEDVHVRLVIHGEL
mmetsp:Transcript_21740/g.62469  ORF Transcript_21740/g.62469 Transcript_21740/m.62469 type:complete len:235 (+) Transcript_21740:405-1109(+)